MVVATLHAELELPMPDEGVIAQRDRAVLLLFNVMKTLASVCPNDNHRNLYADAYALIAEYGFSIDEAANVRHAEAYAAWEAKRR